MDNSIVGAIIAYSLIYLFIGWLFFISMEICEYNLFYILLHIDEYYKHIRVKHLIIFLIFIPITILVYVFIIVFILVLSLPTLLLYLLFMFYESSTWYKIEKIANKKIFK